jgi:hypothetical protein
MENAEILALFQLAAKGENLRVGFVERILEADHDLTHGHGRIVAALDGQQKQFPEQVARSPVILKYLDEVSRPADIFRNNSAVSGDLVVVPQANGDQQDFGGHGGGFIGLGDGVVTSLTIRLQIAWGRDENAVGIESVGHRESSIAEAARSQQGLG